jgi:hypothetical protein
MVKVVRNHTGKCIGPTFFKGSVPIDGVWATANINITKSCIMPAGYGVGDHRLFVVDFQEESLIGASSFCIKQFTSRRLNTKVSNGATRNYIASIEDNLAQSSNWYNYIPRATQNEPFNTNLIVWISRVGIS